MKTENIGEKTYKNLDEVIYDWDNLPYSEKIKLPFFGKPMMFTENVFTWDNKRFIDSFGSVKDRCRICGEDPAICLHHV